MAGEPQYVASAVGDKVVGAHRRVRDRRRARTAERSPVRARSIEVPMAETLTAFGLVEHLWGRIFEPPRGEARYPRMSSPFRRPFPTADGWISRRRLQRPELAALLRAGRPRRTSPTNRGSRRCATRTENLDELYALVGEHLRSGTTAEWFERLREAGIPAAPYNRVDDLFDDPHLAAVGFWRSSTIPPRVRRCSTSRRSASTASGAPLGRPAPTLGADTAEVLARARLKPVRQSCRRRATGRWAHSRRGSPARCSTKRSSARALEHHVAVHARESRERRAVERRSDATSTMLPP